MHVLNTVVVNFNEKVSPRWLKINREIVILLEASVRKALKLKTNHYMLLFSSKKKKSVFKIRIVTELNYSCCIIDYNYY